MDNNPHVRVPSLRSKKNGRSAHLDRFIKLIMNRFSSVGVEVDDIDEGDIFIINDCGRPWQQTHLPQCLCQQPRWRHLAKDAPRYSSACLVFTIQLRLTFIPDNVEHMLCLDLCMFSDKS